MNKKRQIVCSVLICMLLMGIYRIVYENYLHGVDRLAFLLLILAFSAIILICFGQRMKAQKKNVSKDWLVFVFPIA